MGDDEEGSMRRSPATLREAAQGVIGGIISSGSGPAAPVFDEFDAAVEQQRGRWYNVDGDAVDRLRAAIEATESARDGSTGAGGLEAFAVFAPDGALVLLTEDEEEAFREAAALRERGRAPTIMRYRADARWTDAKGFRGDGRWGDLG